MIVASIVAAAALAAAAPHPHPCQTALPHGPRVPAPIVLWTSCGGYLLSPAGTVACLPRHWLARHDGGTGRRFGAHLDIRRTPAGRFLLLESGRLVWRSTHLYPRDGGDVAFGPHAFAFASYRHGIYLTDLHSPERLVLPGRSLGPYTFTAAGDLIVTGPRTITVLSRAGSVLRRLRYRPRNGYGFDQHTDTFSFVTPTGRLAALQGTRVRVARSVATIDGSLSVAGTNLLLFSGAHSLTVTTRSGGVVAADHWQGGNRHLDAGAAVSADGRAFAFRLSNARPGARSARATVYLLHAGATRARPLYRQRLGPSGCASGANLTWHGHSLLDSSSDGTLAVIDIHANRSVELTRLAAALPHRAPGERALAGWRSDFRP